MNVPHPLTEEDCAHLLAEAELTTDANQLYVLSHAIGIEWTWMEQCGMENSKPLLFHAVRRLYTYVRDRAFDALCKESLRGALSQPAYR